MPQDGRSLFASPSLQAGQAAALHSGSRRQKILAALANGPLTIFEISELLGVYDHQIAGRFSELEKDNLIHRPGPRRRNPRTGCDAEVYALVPPKPTTPARMELADMLGYPATLIIEDQTFQRMPIDPTDNAPAIPYARDAEAGGLRLAHRVSLVECDGCGRLLKLVTEPTSGAAKKVWRCGTEGCRRAWHLMIVREPGGPQLLALVMRTF